MPTQTQHDLFYKNNLMKSLLLLLGIIMTSAIHGQMNYYVSPSGNNTNAGTISSPWLSVQHGLNQLAAGDTLNVLAGTYNEKITISTHGTYLRNYQSGAVILDALNLPSLEPIISIINKSNVTVDGLELKNNIKNDAQGILISGSSTNITIQNCVIHDIHFSSDINAPVNANTNAQGIIVYGTNAAIPISNLNIRNNTLRDCRLGYSEGIAVNGNVDGFEVSGNTVYNLTNIGLDAIGHEGTCASAAVDQARNGIFKNNIVHHCISAYATSGGIYIDGAKLITIENNTSYHNGFGIEIGCENIGKSAESIVVRDNILYDNEVAALALGGYDYPIGSGKVTNSSVRNNTCYSNDFSESGNGELYLSYSENSVIENNIFYTSSQNSLAYAELTQPGLSFDYNTAFCLNGSNNLAVDWNGNSYGDFNSFVSGSMTNVHSVFNDPLFLSANINTPNFHLNPLSPCINAGNPNYTAPSEEIDIDGEARNNDVTDCGADEYYSTTGTDGILQEIEFKVYPNPFSTLAYIEFERDIQNAQLCISNSLGQIVAQQFFSGQKIIIDSNGLPRGIYLLTIIQDHQKVMTCKLVVAD
jgi:Secretion system C-terminal sorting domain/Right handed beta helix region